jgi:transposase-like protein
MYAMLRMTGTRTGLPAAQLQRELGITYKAAWGMLHKIREQMGEPGELKGEVEVDETFIHGNTYKRSSAKRKYGHTGARQGQIVLGMVERDGKAKLFHVRSAGARVILPKIEENIRFGSTVYTDGYMGYRSLTRRGYTHYSTNHSAFEWADGDNHVQNVESLWSRFKMGIKADYRFVSDKHLQKYADEFGFRHSHRNSTSMFWALAGQVAQSPSLPSSESPSS